MPTRIVGCMRAIRTIFETALLGFALAVAAVPAHADRDAVQFFQNITVTPDMSAHDVVCFFCSARVDGEVRGDIVVFFGNVRINGQAHHDVVNFFGRTTVTDNSAIDHDLVNFFGGIRLGENAHVGRDMVCFFGGVHAPGSASVGGDRVNIPALIFYGPVIFLILVIWRIAHEVRARQRRQWLAGGYPYPPQR